MKKRELRLTFCKGDLFAIMLVIAAALLIMFFFRANVSTEEESMVSVYQDGQLIREIPLNDNVEMLVEGVYSNKILVKDGKAAIVESDCPGEDCVHSGWIHEAGRSIVCLPNRVEVRIEGASEVDFVVR